MANYEEKRFWDQLLQYIGERKVIPIVGPDLLTIKYNGQEIPLYSILAKKLAEEYRVSIKDIPDGDEINAVISRIILKRNKDIIGELHVVLNGLLPSLMNFAIPEPLIQLAEIRPFKLFISTTFDSLLEKALNNVRYNNQARTEIYSYKKGEKIDIIPKRINSDVSSIFHLFGKISPFQSCAITHEDTLQYIHFLQTKEYRPTELYNIMNSHSLLLLGCNYRDWLARFFLWTPKFDREHSNTHHDFIADYRMSRDKDLVVFLEAFSGTTKMFKGFGAVDFVKELHHRCKEFNYNEVSNEKLLPNLNDELDTCSSFAFISYAHEDFDAADKISKSLKSSGLEVFFDKDTIHSGEYWDAKIKNAMNKCAVFIPIISNSTITGESRYFIKEWRMANDKAETFLENIPFIFPITLDSTPKDELHLFEGFKKVQWEYSLNGNVSPEFIARVKKRIRDHQIEIKLKR